jgi:hypothetical protein
MGLDLNAMRTRLYKISQLITEAIEAAPDHNDYVDETLLQAKQLTENGIALIEEST